MRRRACPAAARGFSVAKASCLCLPRSGIENIARPIGQTRSYHSVKAVVTSVSRLYFRVTFEMSQRFKLVQTVEG